MSNEVHNIGDTFRYNGVLLRVEAERKGHVNGGCGDCCFFRKQDLICYGDSKSHPPCNSLGRNGPPCIFVAVPEPEKPTTPESIPDMPIGSQFKLPGMDCFVTVVEGGTDKDCAERCFFWNNPGCGIKGSELCCDIERHDETDVHYRRVPPSSNVAAIREKVVEMHAKQEFAAGCFARLACGHFIDGMPPEADETSGVVMVLEAELSVSKSRVDGLRKQLSEANESIDLQCREIADQDKQIDRQAKHLADLRDDASERVELLEKKVNGVVGESKRWQAETLEKREYIYTLRRHHHDVVAENEKLRRQLVKWEPQLAETEVTPEVTSTTPLYPAVESFLAEVKGWNMGDISRSCSEKVIDFVTLLEKGVQEAEARGVAKVVAFAGSCRDNTVRGPVAVDTYGYIIARFTPPEPETMGHHEALLAAVDGKKITRQSAPPRSYIDRSPEDDHVFVFHYSDGVTENYAPSPECVLATDWVVVESEVGDGT